MAIEKNELLELLTPHFEGAQIELQDLVGDGDHYKISIFWDGFEGMSRVLQHRAVYNALGDVAGGKLHALMIETKLRKDHV
jgi:stress-induced morphogen